jgi:dihydroneopterin aldolase
MDRLLLQGMVFFGRHGALAAERDLGARFQVDVTLEADLEAARRSDRLEDTINYTDVYRLVQREVEGEPRTLLEALAERIAGGVLDLGRAERVTVRVTKRPPVPEEFHAFAVEVTKP